MADYEEILDTQIEPDAPLTAVLAAQWRDNPLAMFEGASDAPRLAWKTIAASGSTVTITSLSPQFGGAYCVIPARFSAQAGSTSGITMAVNTGSGYSSPQAVFSVQGPVSGMLETVVVFVDFISGNWRSVVSGNDRSGNFSGVSNNVTGLRFSPGEFGSVSMGVMATLQGGDSVT